MVKYTREMIQSQNIIQTLYNCNDPEGYTNVIQYQVE